MKIYKSIQWYEYAKCGKTHFQNKLGPVYWPNLHKFYSENQQLLKQVYICKEEHEKHGEETHWTPMGWSSCMFLTVLRLNHYEEVKGKMWYRKN